jgi:hypothetical protein
VKFKRRCIFEAFLQHGICTLFQDKTVYAGWLCVRGFLKTAVLDPAQKSKTGYEIPPIHLKPDMKSRPST